MSDSCSHLFTGPMALIAVSPSAALIVYKWACCILLVRWQTWYGTASVSSYIEVSDNANPAFFFECCPCECSTSGVGTSQHRWSEISAAVLLWAVHAQQVSCTAVDWPTAAHSPTPQFLFNCPQPGTELRSSPGFKRFASCRDAMLVLDGHSLCIRCLGEGHISAKCIHCTKMMARARRNKYLWLKLILLEKSLKSASEPSSDEKRDKNKTHSSTTMRKRALTSQQRDTLKKEVVFYQISTTCAVCLLWALLMPLAPSTSIRHQCLQKKSMAPKQSLDAITALPAPPKSVLSSTLRRWHQLYSTDNIGTDTVGTEQSSMQVKNTMYQQEHIKSNGTTTATSVWSGRQHRTINATFTSIQQWQITHSTGWHINSCESVHKQFQDPFKKVAISQDKPLKEVAKS